MLLRASGEAQEKQVDLNSVIDDAPGEADGIENSAELAAFVDAAAKHETAKLPAARDALRAAVGAAGVSDAAAVIGNFQRLNRIADAAGIPLDNATRVLGARVNEELGFDDFATADQSKKTGRVAQAIGSFVAPVALRLLGVAGGQLAKSRRRKRR